MGLKRGAIGNTLGKHIENLMGTHCVLEGNMLGTKEKWKKIKALWGHAEPSHWLPWNFYFQNCLSPFLAWVNTSIINWGYLFIHISYLLDEMPPKYFYFFSPSMSQFDWTITQKMKLWKLPKIEPSILKYRVPPLWLTYKGERRTTFAKAYGSPPLQHREIEKQGKMED